MEIFYTKIKKLKNKRINIASFNNTMKRLRYWANVNKFDRRGVNQILKKFVTNDPSWEEYAEEVLC